MLWQKFIMHLLFSQHLLHWPSCLSILIFILYWFVCGSMVDCRIYDWSLLSPALMIAYVILIKCDRIITGSIFTCIARNMHENNYQEPWTTLMFSHQIQISSFGDVIKINSFPKFAELSVVVSSYQSSTCVCVVK